MLVTFGASLALAVLAIMVAVAAFVMLWINGGPGAGAAITGVFIAVLLLGYPAYLGYLAYTLPAIKDITTDPIDPPRFEAIAKLRPRDSNPTTYAGLYAAELQHAAYSDIEPDLTDSTPQEAYDAAMKVIIKRKWRIVDARAPQIVLPQAVAPRRVDPQAAQNVTARDGVIEAVARTPILGFRDDVVVRVRSSSGGTRIDVRSASRYGRHDLGTNAKRVRDLIEDIDDVLSAPQPVKKPAPPPKPNQAAGKGTSAKR